MESILTNLYPKNVFEYFNKVSSLHRIPGNNDEIIEFLTNFAITNNLEYKQDLYGNIVIYKNASYGYENHESVILHTNTDMICEKSSELEGKFDFSKDSLNISVMDDYIFSTGTTLGAQSGIGMSYILSILSDNSLDHPAIEAVFTLDAHDNLSGAKNFDISLLKGKKYINPTHIKEGELLTSCAGMRKIKSEISVSTLNYTGVKYNLVICGLVGGNSGNEIDKGRGNANILMGRFVHYIAKNVSLKIGYLKGGLDDNMIPREAKAEIFVSESDIDKVEDLISNFVGIIEREYGDVENNLTVYGQNIGICDALVLDEDSQNKILLVLNDLPDGVIKMSRNGDDLVQTSLNCGIMRLSRSKFELYINIKSLLDSEKEALSDRIQYLTNYMDGSYEIESDCSAWEYNYDSDLRDLAFEVYQRCFERNPHLTGYHSGLEAGVFYNRIDGIDIICFGPDIDACNTIKEQVYIPSVEKNYEFLTEIIANC